MTEQELKEIEENIRQILAPSDTPVDRMDKMVKQVFIIKQDVPKLVAEIRRLRASRPLCEDCGRPSDTGYWEDIQHEKGDTCSWHALQNTGLTYVAAHIDAEKRMAEGYWQVRCRGCDLWFWAYGPAVKRKVAPDDSTGTDPKT